MGAAELDAWVAYWGEEPWGAVRDNLHAGMIAATIANVAPRGKRSRVFSYSDFMIQGASERTQKQAGAKASLVAFLRMAAGDRKRKAKR